MNLPDADKVGFVPPIMPMSMPRNRLLQIKTPTDMAEEQAEQDRLSKAITAPGAASPLIAHLRTLLVNAKRAREDGKVDKMLREAQLALNGEYSAEKKQQIKEQGQADIYIHLTETKYNAACSWISDMRNNLDGRDWDIEPTPLPNLSSKVKAIAEKRAREAALQDFNAGHPYPSAEELGEFVVKLQEELKEELEAELQQQAQEAVEAMRKEMGDQLADCDWETALEEFEAYVVGFGTGFLKGPVIRWHRELSWGDDPLNPQVNKRAIPTMAAPNPLDIFPVASAQDTQDGIFERLWLTKEQLLSFRGLKYYQDEGIAELVRSYPDGKTDAVSIATDSVRDSQEQKPTRVENAGGRYECWEYWGPLSGDKLSGFGVDGMDPLKTYSMQVIWAGNWPIKIMVNPDPLGVIPYFKAVFKKRPGSFWGKSIYSLMKDAQDFTNSSARAICTNEAMASGPMVWIDTSVVHPDDVKIPHPGMVGRYDGEELATRSGKNSPIEAWQADSNAAELLVLWAKGETMADNETGVPSYSYGSDSAAGAGKTASGYSMLLNAASRGLKHSLKSMDRAKCGFLKNLYRWNMMYSEKEEIKGDAQIEVKGTIRVIVEELQQARMQEFLVYVEKSPMAQKLMDIEGFNNLIQEYARSVHINPQGIFPSEDELKARIADEKEQLINELMQRMAAGAQVAPGAPGPGFEMPLVNAA